MAHLTISTGGIDICDVRAPSRPKQKFFLLDDEAIDMCIKRCFIMRLTIAYKKQHTRKLSCTIYFCIDMISIFRALCSFILQILYKNLYPIGFRTTGWRRSSRSSNLFRPIALVHRRCRACAWEAMLRCSAYVYIGIVPCIYAQTYIINEYIYIMQRLVCLW